MTDERFINRPMSLALDLARALAAATVLIGHAVQLGMYTGPFPFSELMQHNAVIVFFVLSGLVIANSLQTPGVTLSDYTIARATRILPVSLIALVLGIGLFSINCIIGARLPTVNPVNYSQLTIQSTILPLLFSSEGWFGSGPVWNPPYWSLCYEVWYYAIFAAAVFLRGWRRKLWVSALCLAAGPRILLLLPVWLVGVWLASNAMRWRLSTGRGWLLVGLAAAAFGALSSSSIAVKDELFRFTEIGEPGFRFSQFVLTDIPMGMATALGFVGLRPLAMTIATLLEKSAKLIQSAAGCSFSVYLLHWPILCLLTTRGISAGPSFTIFVLLLLGILGFCALVAEVTERRRYTLRAVLRKVFTHRSATAVTV